MPEKDPNSELAKMIGRAIIDPIFARDMIRDPATAAREIGADLDDEQMRALGDLSADQLRRISDLSGQFSELMDHIQQQQQQQQAQAD